MSMIEEPTRPSPTRERGCPICGGQARPWSVINDFDLHTCAGCGCRFVWPQPTSEELQKIYSGEYFAGGSEGWGFSSYEALGSSLRRMFRRHLGTIRQFVGSPTTLLDVGCAYGFFLAEAASAGWQIAGVEISKDATKHASDRLQIDVFAGTLTEAFPTLDEASFKAVTFWDTLEHVTDPIGDLTLANKLLEPGGCVFLSVPKAWGVLPRLMSRQWFGYKKAGEHLFFHTKQSLASALEAAGFDALLIKRTSWTCNVGFLAGKLAYYSPAISKIVLKVVKALRLDNFPIAFPWINALVVGRKKP